MALHRECKIGRTHAAPVILDEDATHAAALQRDGDSPRAGIQRILHQLLHHGGRALDHLAGGDTVGGGLGQDADRVHAGRDSAPIIAWNAYLVRSFAISAFSASFSALSVSTSFTGRP